MLALNDDLSDLSLEGLDDSIGPSELREKDLELCFALLFAMLGLEERVAVDLDLIDFLDDSVCPLLVVFDLVNMLVGLLTIAPFAHVGVLFAVNF